MNWKPITRILPAIAACALGMASAAQKPNVLLIMVDDLGYGDLTCYGGQNLQTPHVDKLMGEGMRFNEFYANCCVCSPTRAALLSGRYPEMVGIPGVVRTMEASNWGCLTPESVLLPELFQKAGYQTILIGKWHLGLTEPNWPNNRGFDRFHGFLGDMMDDYWHHRRHDRNYMRDNKKVIEPAGHATDLFTEWAIAEIRKSAKSGKPFFHYLAYNAPHTPIHPPEDWVARVKKREPDLGEKKVKMNAFIEHLDDGIGKVLAALDECSLRKNTIVVFTSDNGGNIGPGASNGKLRSGKTHVYEGGIKVPTCVRWPGRIKAGGQTDFHALTMDLVPTLADLCGVKIGHDIEGRSFKKQLLEGSQAPFKRPVFHMWLQKATKETVRFGDWKLLRDKAGAPFELYNIREDPCETTDLAKKAPEKFQELKGILEAHMKKTSAVPWKRKGDY